MDIELSGSRIRTSNFENFNGKMEDDEIEGKLNGGGTKIRVNAGSGNVFFNVK